MKRLAASFLLLLSACGDATDTSPSLDGGDVTADVDAAQDIEAPDVFDTAPDTLPDVATDASDATDTLFEAPTALLDGPTYVRPGDVVHLDASQSTAAVAYTFNLGGGNIIGPQDEATLTTQWDEPGRYTVTLTVLGHDGSRVRDTLLVTVIDAPTFVPQRNGSIAIFDDGDRVAGLSTDADELTIFSGLTDGVLAVEARYSTCRGPRNMTVWNDVLVVSCPEVDTLAVIDPTDGTTAFRSLPYGSRPFGMVVVADTLAVVLSGPGELAMFDDIDAEPSVTSVGPDARGIAVLPEGRLWISRWRSPDGQGVLYALSATGEAEAPFALAIDPTPASDTESGGVPNYLDHIAVSPQADRAVIPMLQANVNQGLSRNGEALTHETTVRAALAYVQLDPLEENPSIRRRFDDRGLVSSAVYSPNGDWLYVTMRGTQTVERLDMFNRTVSGLEFDIGFAPEDVAVSPDGTRLLIDAALSRELVVYDATTFGTAIEPLQRLPLVTEEPLDPVLLRGKQLFNDSLDVRLTQDSYVACAHCHLDGESDHLTWDFTDRNEGLRNTITLRGRAGDGHGPMHWSANFDEVQDFEHDIRGPFAGLGLMDDADFHAGRDTPFGAPKAGVSEDLDALAAYVTSLDTFPRSPNRTADGSLSEAAVRGQALFESATLGCTGCHSGTQMTDSAVVDGLPILHDVGTLTSESGMRLGGTLTGLDTPTLRGLWNSAPYLHDGSAMTVVDAVRDRVGHGATSALTDADWDDLETYLLSLD